MLALGPITLAALLALSATGEVEQLKQLREELEEELLTPEELALAALLSSTSTSTPVAVPVPVPVPVPSGAAGRSPAGSTTSSPTRTSSVRKFFNPNRTRISRAAGLEAAPRSQAEALDDSITPLRSVRATRPTGETMNGLTLLRPRSPFLGWTHGSARILSGASIRIGGPLSTGPEETVVEMALANPIRVARAPRPRGRDARSSAHTNASASAGLGLSSRLSSSSSSDTDTDTDTDWAWTSSVTAVARSADRSMGAAIDFASRAGIFGLRIAADFEAQEPWGTSSSTTAGSVDTPPRRRRLAASAVTSLFGRAEDPLELVLGGAFQETSGTGIDQVRHYLLLGHARGWSSTRRVEFEARTGYEGLDERATRAKRLQGNLAVNLVPLRAVRIGATVFGRTDWLDDARQAAVAAHELGASAKARLDLGRVWTAWAFRIQHDRTAGPEGSAASLEDDRFTPNETSTLCLFTGSASLKLAGPFSFRFGARRNARVPSVFEQRAREDVLAFLRPERTLTIEAGPELRSEDVRLHLIAFRQWITDGITPTSNTWRQFKNDAPAAVFGMEVAAATKLTRHLEAEAIVGWADDDRATEKRSVLSVASRVLGDVIVRYTASPTFGTFSVHGQFASGPWRSKTPTASSTASSLGGASDTMGATGAVYPDQRAASIWVGMGWNVAFSRNVRFDLRVDNLFNQPYFVAPTQVRPSGIDVRCALTMGL
ncbi:MAG: TonB-dependent receptor [Deltaproteobacteria bacterium]|nr:TonB-dependent receptor [Deltaproteobacteria bacterium]